MLFMSLRALSFKHQKLVQSSRRTVLTFDSVSSWYRKQYYPRFPTPPYKHVCQVGDPVLRQPAKLVDPTLICTPPIQQIIAMMWRVHEEYECVGLSAAQVGIPLQIFVVHVSNKNMEKTRSPDIIPISRKIVINPTVKIIDYNKTTLPECCASVCSFSADVPRYSAIKIDALNETGKQQSWEARGFEARLIQHEMDHLSGILFTDRMDAKTLECTAWQHVNHHSGGIAIPYRPKKSLFKRLMEKFNS